MRDKPGRMRDDAGMSRLTTWFSESFVRNPAVWLLLGAFLLAEWGNWNRGAELSRVCQLLGDHDVSVAHPRTAKQEIDNICINRQSGDD